MKKGVIVLAIVAVILGVATFAFFEFCSIENQSIDVKITMEIEETKVELDTHLSIIPHGKELIYALELEEQEVFFYKDVVYFKNGRGFRMGQGSIDTSWNQMAFALQKLSSDEIEISGEVQLEGAAKPIRISATLSDFHEIEEGSYIIPDEVKQSIAQKKAQEFPILKEDLSRLYLAWMDFNGQEELTGSLQLKASCGMINFAYNLPWTSNGVESTQVSNPKELAQMPEMIYTICMEGEFSCEKRGDDYRYMLQLDGATTKKLATMIAPEIVTQVVTLDQGTLYITVENQKISGIEVDIDGSLKLLIVEVAASFGAVFEFEQ